MTSQQGRPSTALLVLAAVAVAFAAADTYVVVLALPDMMITVGLGVDELQRAAPIVSGFLLGYVAMLPLIGRVADLRGRVPVLVASLVVFGLGSLVTALAFDLPSVVTGRFFQGVGGGGLVPATLALVADLYPIERRAVPLGVVSAVQEVGAVLGPLYGAAVLALADWETIFWINLAAALVLAAALRTAARVSTPASAVARPPHERTLPDVVGLALLLVFLAALVLLLGEPRALVSDVTLGLPFVPLAGTSRWLTPLALVAVAAVVLFVVRCLLARRPLLDLRAWWRTLGEADLVGAVLLAISLGGVVLTFAGVDPARNGVSAAAPVLLLVSVLAALVLARHLRRTARPLVPRGALRATPAWAGLLVSFFVGAALIAALVEIPVYARLTTYKTSQLLAALVLLRLLVAVPVGAVAGGYLLRRLPAGRVCAGGMALATLGFLAMSRFGATSLEHAWVSVPLVLTGLGFGLAITPVNTVVLAHTEPAVHGVVSSLVVVARMIGMLVGISALTAIGLRIFYAHIRSDPDHELGAALAQSQAIFLGAALCAAVAALLALVLIRERTRSPSPGSVGAMS